MNEVEPIKFFHQRLKDERKRLGLTQQAMATAGGVSKRTYCNYEAGSRLPDAAFLSAIVEIGVDVIYLLTNQRHV